MSAPQNPFDKSSITRAGIYGVVLAIIGIGIFLTLWIVTDNLGMNVFTRLVLSICLPPTTLALLMGIYLLVMRPNFK